MEKALEILKHFQTIELVNEDTQFESSFYAQAIIEIEEAMKPKTCKGCLFGKITLNSVICGKSGTYKEYDDYCKYHEPKDNA